MRAILARILAIVLAGGLLRSPAVTTPQQPLIAIRHVESQGRKIPVLLSRNERGSVAGRLLIGADDAPILDGPTLESVLATIESHIEGLLLARMRCV